LAKAAIFDLDGTLLESVDLHAIARHEAMVKFGHNVSFEQARSQIGKGGDKLIPVFLSIDDQRDHGKELDAWRGQRFKAKYLPLVRPFSAVPDLLRRTREAGLKIAIASSAKRDELNQYLEIAHITKLVDVTSSSEDADESKPAPDVFEIVLKKLGIAGEDAVAIGDTPYDAIAAGKAYIPTVGVLCGGFTEDWLRQAGCVEVYPGPATLFASFDRCLLIQ
jgi:HAD superfamily hydrolase (TIGR01549 family)